MVAPRFLSASKTEAARRIIAAAKAGVPSITDTLASAPTYTQSSSATITLISKSVADPLITPIGGPWGLITAGLYRIQGVSRLSGTRGNGHGSGISFGFYGQTFEIGANFLGVGFAVYVTDFVSGKRVRTQANDYVDTTGFAYHKIAMASTGYYGIEVYTNSAGNNSGTFGVVNIGVGASIFKWRRPEPRIGLLWDSWGVGTLTSGTNPTKLAVADYFGAAVGVANVFAPAMGGTGFLATNNSTEYKYRDRIVAGDLDESRVGSLDLLMVSGSLNDYALSGNTAAATQAEISLALPLLRVAQPNAIIALTGPQWTPVNNVPQSWYDAHKAAFDAWGDAGSVYLDNSPSGENWLNANINSVAFTGSQNHVNDVGKVIYGTTMGNSLVAALRAKFNV